MKKISSLLCIISSIHITSIKAAEEYRIHSQERPTESSSALSSEHKKELEDEHRDMINEHNKTRREHKEIQKELQSHTGTILDNDHFKYKADDDEPVSIYDDSSEEHSEAIVSLYNQTVREYNETFPDQRAKESIHINDLGDQKDIAADIQHMHEEIEKEKLNAANQAMRKNKSKIENDFLDQLKQVHDRNTKEKEDEKRKNERDKQEEQKNKERQQQEARSKKNEADAKKEAAFKKAQADAAKEANRLPNVDKNIFAKIKDFLLGRTKTASKDIAEAFTKAEPLADAKHALRDLSKEQRLEAINDALLLSSKAPGDLEIATNKLNEILPKNEQLFFDKKTFKASFAQ